METDLTSKLPLREHIRNIRKMLQVIHKLDKYFYLYMGAKSLLDTLATYLGLLLSVDILDQLTAGADFRQCLAAAAATCALLFVIQFSGGMLHNRLNVRWETIYRRWDCMTEEKILQMDFANIDSPQTRKMRERIWRDNDWGSGIHAMRWQVHIVLNSLCSLVGAVLVGAPVFFYIVRA